jgi:hypothetical protein
MEKLPSRYSVGGASIHETILVLSCRTGISSSHFRQYLAFSVMAAKTVTNLWAAEAYKYVPAEGVMLCLIATAVVSSSGK